MTDFNIKPKSTNNSSINETVVVNKFQYMFLRNENFTYQWHFAKIMFGRNIENSIKSLS